MTSPVRLSQWCSPVRGPRALGAALMMLVMVAAMLAPPVSAQTDAGRVSKLSVINGKILSLAGAPEAFPQGSQTVFIRGAARNPATAVLVRISDFWSSAEWHPDRTCSKPAFQRTCASGAMGEGMRFSQANLTPAAFGGRKFTFKADLPDGMYRMAIRTRSANGTVGAPVVRWFKVARNTNRWLSGAQVIETTPAKFETISTNNGTNEVQFRVETPTAAVNLDWSLRQDRTNTFWNEDSRTFAGFVTNHRRIFDGWRSIERGRTYYNWSVPLPPGNYTMWVTALDGNGNKGGTNRRDFHVVV